MEQSINFKSKLNELVSQYEKYNEEWKNLSSQLATDLQIDETFLDGELMKHSAIFYHYSSFLNDVEMLYDNFKTLLEAFESQEELGIRASAELNNVKTTEGKIEAQINSNNEIVYYRMQLNMLKGLLNGLKTVKDALTQKKDMLVSLSANLREQFRNDINSING